MTSMAAHTSSGIERSAFSTRRAASRSSVTRPAAVRWLAGSASSSPKAAASTVPISDIASVSNAPAPTLRRKAPDRSGGKKPLRNSAMLRSGVVLEERSPLDVERREAGDDEAREGD